MGLNSRLNLLGMRLSPKYRGFYNLVSIMIYFNLFGGILSVHSAGIAFSLNKLVVDQWKE